MALMTQNASSTALVANNLPIPAMGGLVPLGSLEAYIGAVNQIPVLPVEDEQVLARAYRDEDDLAEVISSGRSFVEVDHTGCALA